MSSLRVAVDIGGTFTDVVLLEAARGEFRALKVPTTAGDPSIGALEGIKAILRDGGYEGGEISYFCHGTTVGTNAVLEGKLAKAALITTRGFRDVLEIGRQRRPDQYNFFAVKLPPPIPRRLRFTVTERVGSDGRILTPLVEEELGSVVKALKREGVKGVAICFLFSFLNATHEQRVRDLLRDALPGVEIYLSSEVLPENREYERSFTVAVSAALAPVLTDYLARLEKRLKEAGGAGEPSLMKSSGGIMPFSTVTRRPIETILSGPAAGALATAFMGRVIGRPNLIGLDMGGTSCDVSLIVGGEPLITTEGRIGNFPLRHPLIDLRTIGAGGGSIAWLDLAGALHVGPQSAGAEPGPVCYGRGGELPTVTDANLIAGRIGVGSLFAGGVTLQVEKAAAALREQIAAPLDMDLSRAALSVLEIVNANMVGAIRALTVERGHDPREFALMAFGGCGPLHATFLAEELGIPEIIVPVAAGVFSALGLLAADVRLDLSQAHLALLDQVEPEMVEEGFRRLEARARDELGDYSGEGQILLRSVDLRYQGQSYEITLPLPKEAGPGEMAGAFHDRHRQLYWWSDPRRAVELVTLRLSVVVPLPRPPLSRAAEARGGNPARALRARREVSFGDGGLVATPVYDRSLLIWGDVLEGPAVVESTDATILLVPGEQAVVDPFRNLCITRRLGR